MQRALSFLKRPEARLPLLGTLAVGLLVGFVVGAFTVKDPEHTYLLREIRASVQSHTCSGWAEAADSEARKDEIYRAVGQALLDWERSNARKPGS